MSPKDVTMSIADKRAGSKDSGVPCCEIITVGSELLLGAVNDTNSGYLARKLGEIGVRVRFRTAVGDRRADMAEALELALGRCDAVLFTGGLGPTEDDLTREVAAGAAGVGLVFDQELMAEIEELFRRIGYHMTENNRKQAYIPEGALPLSNPVGTAPGFILEVEGKPLVCLPGVPGELAHLMENRVLGWLKERFELGEGRIARRVLHVVGMGESKVDRALGDLMGEDRNPEVGLLASEGEIRVEMTAYGEKAVQGHPDMEALEAEIRRRLGSKVFGGGGETLEGVVERLLVEREAGLVVLETFTAGLAAGRLHALPSKALLESRVIPGEEALACWHRGPLPEEGREAAASLAARAMAETGADTALVILGRPGGAEIEATALAVVPGAGGKAFSWRSATDFPGLERRGAVIGLNTLRLALLEAGR